MALNYNWKVTQLKKTTQSGASDVIINVRWILEGTDTESGESGKFHGATPFEYVSGSFTPYEELTEEEVLGWVQNYVSGSGGYQEHIDERIWKEIDDKLNVKEEVEETALPWAPPVTGSASGSEEV